MFSLVQPSSPLILCLYAKRDAHSNTLIGTHWHEMPIPLASQSGSFWNSFSFNQLNVSRVDIPCALKNEAGEAVLSTQRQPVTLYMTVTVLADITVPNLPKSPPNIPTEDDDPSGKETTTPGRIQITAVEPASSLLHHPPIENDIPMSRSREEISPTEDPPFARVDEAMKAIVPIDRSKTWESAVERINWVMDTLSPIAGVRTMPFLLSLTKLTSIQLFPLAKMAHGLLSVIPKVRPIASYSKQSAYSMFVLMIDTPRTVST